MSRGHLAWVAGSVVGAALLVQGRGLETRLEVSARILGSESAEVERALDERFRSPLAHHVLLVVSGLPRPDHTPGRLALQEIVQALTAAPGVTRTLSYLDRPDPFLLGADGQGTLVVVGFELAAGRAERIVPILREATHGLEDRLRARFPGVALRLSGEAALNYDLWHLSTTSTRTAERRALPLTVALLLLAFGTAAAAALPALAGLLAIGLSLGAADLVNRAEPLSVLAVDVISMLGLALGIDYALLAVSRFREEMAAGREASAAADETARHAGSTVVLSGSAVALGFLAVLLVPLQEMRSAAIGGLLVVLFAVLIATTLLPPLLRMLGARVDWGRVSWPSRRSARDPWRRWGSFVVDRPVLVLALATPPLVVLALQSFRLDPRVPDGDWLPAEMESARANAGLRAMARAGLTQGLRVLVDLPEGTQALSREGWAATARLADAVRNDHRVARVHGVRDLVDDAGDPRAAVAFLPSWVKRSYLSEEGDAVLLEVVPREGLGGRDAQGLVRDLRKADAAYLTGLSGARIRVGGLPAFSVDYEHAVRGRFATIAGLIVACTLLALAVAFRSVLIPLKAVALNLLTVGAAFGALVLVFQDGHGARWLGLLGPLDGVFPIVPVLVFSTVFGLSLDYEVFLVARVAEGRRRGLQEGDAVVFGLERTARVVTSAASIMVAVFGAFTLGGFVLLKMLGFALAVAVLLDATVIRMAIGPALLRLAGRYNWWPGPNRAIRTGARRDLPLQ